MKIVRRSLVVVGCSMAAFAMLIGIEVVTGSGKVVMAEKQALIAHKVLDRRESGSTKLVLNVEVQLVDGRPPYEGELRALSEHLVGSETAYEKKFVTFYLPGMKKGKGAYATGHHNPDLQVYLRPYTLLKYPEYEKFAF
jgi:hypothetical protein